MKNLIIILLSLLPILSYSKNSSSTKPVNIPDSTQLTLKTVYNDFKDGVSGLASALKVGSEQVFTILVKQQLVYAITCLTVCISLIIATFCLILYTKKNWKDVSDGSNEFFSILSTVFTIITVLVFCCSMNTIITGFFNPEYGAIKDILEFIKK